MIQTFKPLCLVLALLAAISVLSGAFRVRRDEAFVGYSERSVRLGDGNDAQSRDTRDQAAAAVYIDNPACVDGDSACGDWARKGECARNAAFMSNTCRKACELCQTRVNVGPYHRRNVEFVTSYGTVSVNLLWDAAPETCALIAELASANELAGSRFYRNEPVPVNGVGPPYALLQGVMSQLAKAPPKESVTNIQRGHLASIHPEKDFYIALAPHENWSSAHTAWGFIDDLSVVEAIVQQPYTESVHAETGTHMRMLQEPVSFVLQLADAPADGVMDVGRRMLHDR